MSNSFGRILKVTTFGESHGPYIGAVIDGCPSNIKICEDEINELLEKRRPVNQFFSTKRKEKDRATIISGVFNKMTTGAPICILIPNIDVDSSYYEEIKGVLKPSHADFTYYKKYKNYDYRGSGRASARETAARVAASLIAEKILEETNIKVFSYLYSVGDIDIVFKEEDFFEKIDKSVIFCPDKKAEEKMLKKLKEIKDEKDSIGGAVGFYIKNTLIGLGEPIYNKLNAKISFLLMSIPGVKAVEFGDGIESSKKTGSLRNDLFKYENQIFHTLTNNEGGINAGISNGEPIYGKVHFKPTPTISKQQKTVDTQGNKKILKSFENDRHDVCIAIRAVPVVKAMIYLALADFYLLNKAYGM
ncbi:MAG: chorismate synthase [Parachlamydiales bacterium]|nr:chorismate synthase [Parachlamydiales bacterium]